MPNKYRPHPDPKKRRPMVNPDYWPRNIKNQVAYLAGVDRVRVTQYLKRTHTPNIETARRLEKATEALLGIAKGIPATTWLQNKSTDHPAFEPLTDAQRRKLHVDEKVRELFVQKNFIAVSSGTACCGRPSTVIKKEIARARLMEESVHQVREEDVRRQLTLDKILLLWGDALDEWKKPETPTKSKNELSLREKLILRRKMKEGENI